MTIKPCSRCGQHVTRCIVFSIVATFGINAHAAQSVESGKSLERTKAHVTLQRWLNHSVDNHPTTLAAESAVDSANYQLVAADKALYNPELEFEAETAETDSASIGLSQTIDWGDTRGARTEMASFRRTAAQFNFESVRRELAVQLLSSLADYHTSAALRDLAKQGEKLMQQSAQLAKQRYDAGDLTKVDVDLANLTYAQARFKLADAASESARATQNLIALTGSATKNWPQMLADYPEPQTQSQDIDKTVQQLPKMRAITARVKAAQANVNVETGQASVKPTISIRAGKEEEDKLLGLNLSIPLHVRNNFQAEINSANAEMIQAQREAIDAYRTLKSRLEIAIISYDLNRGAWLTWKESGADTLNEQIKLLERLWTAGELNTTDYLIQLTQALETKASAIEQRGRMWSDWSEWLIASGKIKRWLNSAPSNISREQ